jgi:hypothetical protein
MANDNRYVLIHVVKRVARSALSLGIAALIALSSKSAVAQSCAKTMACGTTVNGTLDILTGTCLDAETRRYDFYTFEASAGMRLTATVQSAFFIPALQLIDPSSQIVADDENGSRATRASVSFVANVSGTWTVKVRNIVVGDGGPYTLALQCGTPPPPPPENGFALTASPFSITLGRGAAFTTTIGSMAFGNFSSDVTVAPTGIPADFTVTPNTALFPRGIGAADFRITVGNAARNGLTSVIFTGTATDGSLARTSVVITVDAPCSPPLLFPQPAPAPVVRGSQQTLAVEPGGSAPFTYQWYRGPTGSIVFPDQNGRSAAYTTPPLMSDEQFWVRVSNECGSRDSATMTVRVIEPPPKHRSAKH